MRRITITLSDNERQALQVLAEEELRDPRDQAALLIRAELDHRGLLTIVANTMEQVLEARKTQTQISNAKVIDGAIS